MTKRNKERNIETNDTEFTENPIQIIKQMHLKNLIFFSYVLQQLDDSFGFFFQSNSVSFFFF